MKQRVLFILPVTIFVAMLGLGIISPLMPFYAQKLGANGVWIGIIFSSFALARMIFMPIIGKRSDIKGRKKFITAGLFFYSIFSLLYANAGTLYGLSIIRFFHGFVSAMVLPVAMAYMGEVAPKGKEGMVMGIANTSLFLGMGCGPLLGGHLEQAFGMGSVFYVMGGFSFIAFLISLFYLPNIKVEKTADQKKPISYKKILKNNVMRGLLLFRSVNAIGQAAILSFLPILAASIKLGSAQIGLIISVNIFVAGVLQTPFGKLADIVSKKFLIVFGSFLVMISLLFMPMAKSFNFLFFACFLMGIGVALSIPAATAVIAKVGQGIGMGASMGLFDTAMSAGMLTCPLISGVVMDSFGINAVFYVVAGISLFGIGIFYYFLRKI